MAHSIEEVRIKKVVKETVIRLLELNCVPIGVSNRHVHLRYEDYIKLYPNEVLKPKKYLNQPGEFAAEQTVTIVGPRGKAERVRILGPFRKESQVEISQTDARVLGLKAPLRLSGDLDGTPGVKLESPYGKLELPRGLIVAKRHIHMGLDDAKRLGLKQGDEVRVKVNTEGRSLIFEQVTIRANEKMVKEMHIDTDEANAAGIGKDTWAEILLDTKSFC